MTLAGSPLFVPFTCCTPVVGFLVCSTSFFICLFINAEIDETVLVDFVGGALLMNDGTLIFSIDVLDRLVRLFLIKFGLN